jgi:hypothetical protein
VRTTSQIESLDEFRTSSQAMTLLTVLQRTLLFLPHGKYIGRWANAEVRKQVAELLEDVQLRFNVDVDLSRLEGRLKTKSELKHVDVSFPRRTSEELAARKAEYNKMWTGRTAYPGESEESRLGRWTKYSSGNNERRREARLQQEGESDVDFEKRVAERRAEEAKKYPARASRVKAAKEQQEGESNSDFEKRDRKRKDKINEGATRRRGAVNPIPRVKKEDETQEAFEKRREDMKAAKTQEKRQYREKQKKEKETAVRVGHRPFFPVTSK